MVAGKEADEKWASLQHVYIAYMIGGSGTSSAVGGKLYHLGLIGKGDSSEVVWFQ